MWVELGVEWILKVGSDLWFSRGCVRGAQADQQGLNAERVFSNSKKSDLMPRESQCHQPQRHWGYKPVSRPLLSTQSQF